MLLTVGSPAFILKALPIPSPPISARRTLSMRDVCSGMHVFRHLASVKGHFEYLVRRIPGLKYLIIFIYLSV